MNSEEALAVLEGVPAPTSSERLRAARFLAQNAITDHQARLSKIRETERNSWVQKALDQALKRSGRGRSVTSMAITDKEVHETPIDTRLYEELRAQAIEETSGWFLHELRPLVGFLNDDAGSEIHYYECSRTKASVDRVKSFLDAIARLRKASAAPEMQEFDLTDLVIRVAENEAKQGRAALDDSKEEAYGEGGLHGDGKHTARQVVIKLSLARRDPVITIGDPQLVEMAVANALRNAVEAVMDVQEENRRYVTLNWGVTDTDSWVVVLDQGCGLPSGLDRLTEPGTSTKSKSGVNLGMGLPIALRAMESMRGTLQLAPRSRAGVACEIRWPHWDRVE